MPELRRFRFWCQSVLPVVYDDSLSYYEVLCKVVAYINNLINTDKLVFDEIDELKKELAVVQTWIDDFNVSYAEKAIKKAIATMVFFGLTDSGYFVAYIPDSWSDVTFATSGYDADIPEMQEYGHLCLAY